MAEMTARVDGLEVRVRREEIDVRMAVPEMEPDPDWSYVDEAGHEHRWIDGELPTVKVVEVETYYCVGCRDWHTIRERRCEECGQAIEPGYRKKDPQPPHRLLGPKRITGTVQPDSPHYEAIRDTFDGAEATIQAGGILLVGVQCTAIDFGGPADFVARRLDQP